METLRKGDEFKRLKNSTKAEWDTLEPDVQQHGALQRAHHSADQIVHREQSAPSVVELLVQAHLVRHGERGLLGNERDVTNCRAVVCRGARRLQTRDGVRVCTKQTWWGS